MLRSTAVTDRTIVETLATRRDPLRVLVAGYDVHVQTALNAVRRNRRFELLGSVAHAAACVSRALRVTPDVIVLDVELPGDAIAAAAELRARLPMTQVVLTHGPEDGTRFLEAIAAGASAFVERRNGDAVADAVSAVAEGRLALSRSQIEQLVDSLRDTRRPRRRVVSGPSLTAREWQIYELMGHASVSEIAALLAISPVTVRSHIRSVRKKTVAGELRNPLLR